MLGMKNTFITKKIQGKVFKFKYSIKKSRSGCYDKEIQIFIIKNEIVDNVKSNHNSYFFYSESICLVEEGRKDYYSVDKKDIQLALKRLKLGEIKLLNTGYEFVY